MLRSRTGAWIAESPLRLEETGALGTSPPTCSHRPRHSWERCDTGLCVPSHPISPVLSLSFILCPLTAPFQPLPQILPHCRPFMSPFCLSPCSFSCPLQPLPYYSLCPLTASAPLTAYPPLLPPTHHYLIHVALISSSIHPDRRSLMDFPHPGRSLRRGCLVIAFPDRRSLMNFPHPGRSLRRGCPGINISRLEPSA